VPPLPPDRAARSEELPLRCRTVLRALVTCLCALAAVHRHGPLIVHPDLDAGYVILTDRQRRLSLQAPAVGLSVVRL
jgi:hypothetical protein